MRHVAKKDPAPRFKDKAKKKPICAVCPKDLPETSIKNGDVFCSATCCHTYHEITVPEPNQSYSGIRR